MISRLQRAAAIGAAPAIPLTTVGAGAQERAVVVGYGPHGEAVDDCLVPAGTVVIGQGKAEKFAFRSSNRYVVGQVTSTSPSWVILVASSSINADGTTDQTRFARLTYPAELVREGAIVARPGYECAHDADERSAGSVEVVPPTGH